MSPIGYDDGLQINLVITPAWFFISWAHGVVVSHPLRMRKALGSIPSVSSVVVHDTLRDKSLPSCVYN